MKENINHDICFNQNATNLRSNSLKLSKSQCNTLRRRRFFSQNVIDVWNSLSQFMVSTPSTNIFKHKLDKNGI